MKTNEGMKDRAFRMILGISLSGILIFQNSAWALIGLIPFVTGVVGICPLYKLMGISTVEQENA
jgi:hypothetical protein